MKNKHEFDIIEIDHGGKDRPFVIKRIPRAHEKRDYIGIASLIIVLFALLIIANEALGNPLLTYFTK